MFHDRFEAWTDIVVLYICFAAFATSFRGRILDTRWGWHPRLVWQGEARFVTSALLGPPLLQVCLQLPVTFKAQGFKSRGGGALRDFLRYWGLPFLQDFQQC